MTLVAMPSPITAVSMQAANGLNIQRPSGWNDTIVIELRRLAEDKTLSASAIATSLNHTYRPLKPFTRNAVIGKCFRLSISLNAKATPGQTKERKPRAARATANGPRLVKLAAPNRFDAMMALPGPVKAGIAISDTHRATLVQNAQSYDLFHQSIVDAQDAEQSIEAFVAPEHLTNYWSGKAPIKLIDAPAGRCLYPTARSTNTYDSYCCGDETGKDSKYCTFHHQLCYQAPKQRKNNSPTPVDHKSKFLAFSDEF